METAPFNPAHINITLVHEGFDEKSERLAAGPERWISTNVRPERLHQLEAAANVGDDLWENGGTTTGEHPQRHVWAWPHYIHELFQREIRGDRFVTLFGVFEQREGVAQWRALAHRKEQVFRDAGLLLDEFEYFRHT